MITLGILGVCGLLASILFYNMSNNVVSEVERLLKEDKLIQKVDELEVAIGWLTLSRKSKHVSQARKHLKGKGENYTYEACKNHDGEQWIIAIPDNGKTYEVISFLPTSDRLHFITSSV